eukprot:CAMPEP_0181065246 /NCGR_PEP_ID=MMETSP1070-20121207/24636_1 /TAXON_ID=265543 /ORGANISM="Minutocellus polymorphus, Strain NH13" /LENGTH=39 /DNA_ID= /DNA_START= /DNA_END= /DNA_ORIENTATION=
MGDATALARVTAAIIGARTAIVLSIGDDGSTSSGNAGGV